MPNRRTELTGAGGLATVRWLRDPGDDVSCGPIPCGVGNLHALLHQTLSGQVSEVAVHGVVRAARHRGDMWQLTVGSVSRTDDQELRVITPAVTSAARRRGAVVKAWGVLEVTSRFELQLQADLVDVVETASSADG